MKIDISIDRKIFNDIYYPYLLNYDNRYEVYYGGSGSGKSVFVAQKLLIKALKSKRKILVVRKTLTSQKDSCWQLILDTLSQFKVLPLCKVNKTNYSIELPNHSLFLCKGMDDSEKIKSITAITDIWCEEATELTLDDFTQLDLRLRSNEPYNQIILSFNPVSKANWCYERWFLNNDDRALVLKSTYKDNRFLPKEYVEQLEALIETNPTYYRIYALGEFCSLNRLVYNNYEIKESDEIDKTHLDLCVGLDWGFTNDPAAIVVSYIDRDNKIIYIDSAWGDTGYTNTQLAEVIKSMGLSKSTIIADSAEPKSIEELKRLGIVRIKESKKGPDSIINGIKKVSEYKIIVNPKLEGVITELQNYCWSKDKKTGEYIEKPEDNFNHYMDALRYSLQCLNHKVVILDKNKLGL